MGGIHFSLIPCAPLKTPGIQRCGPMVKNRPRGVPFFDPFFSKIALFQALRYPVFEKKVRSPRTILGGGTFFSKIGDHMVLLKKWSKRQGLPPVGDFWPFWAEVAPNGEFLGPSVECKVLEKSVSHPYGARSEAIQRVYLSTGSTVPPKYTHLTHAGGIHFSLIPCTPLRAPGIYRLGPL